MHWIPTVDTKINVWMIAAALGAYVALYNTLRGWWRSTIGKRALFVRNYRKLAPHVRHEYVKELFGESAWQYKRSVEQFVDAPELEGAGISIAEQEMTVRTWPLGRMAYLTTWCTEDDEVALYSLTTRSRIFRPAIRIGTEHVIRLGRSRLSSLPHSEVDGPPLWAVGAQQYSYSESHYFGRPGGYRTWVVGVSDAGHPSTAPVGLGANSVESEEPSQIECYRALARINSVLIAGGSALRLESILPSAVGPEIGRVILVEPEYGLRARLTRLRWNARFAEARLREPKSSAE
ncbi:ETEC_3214 domain-containing protein [Streptomyces nanshensis]|uniref:ETEC_3214 domain-containing protein n=1 Tax=Streptomyces nanshensis TaxID=518642 RepID=UPI00085C86FD|nr:ETEC_3214 domain-containing protein [Streptomyces nanshensis]